MNSLKLVTCVVNVLGSAGVGVAFTSVENHQFFLGTENKGQVYQKEKVVIKPRSPHIGF